MATGEVDRVRKAIEALEAQRAMLGDDVVDTAVAPLREQLAALQDAAGPQQQRKLVTTLFLDIVNSTAMVRDMDPEDHLAVTDGAMRRLTQPIESNGGRVLKYMGDGLLAVFGHPVARENDAEMAVRAALQMLSEAREFAGEAKRRWDVPDFAVRMGMSTGMAIIGGGAEGENTVAGRHVNLASRLESAAPPGGLLIAHSTYQQVRGLFDIETLEAIDAKGFDEAQPAYRVLQVRARRFAQTPRGVEGVATRMIGRENEMAILQEAYQALAASGDGRLLTFCGEAGIGKSRLLAEFGAWLEKEAPEARPLHGRAHPQTIGTPYGLLRDLFTAEFGVQEDDSADAVRRKFEEGFRRQEGDSEEALRQAHFSGQLLGYDFSAGPYLGDALDDPKQLRDRALGYVRDYITNAARARPVVIFLEDLHWADNSSLDVLDSLVRGQARLPVLIVTATRPQFFQRFADWGAQYAFYRRVDLSPLSADQSRRLVAEVLQKLDDVPGALGDLIVNSAEGNPFYLEELVKMLVEEGVIIAGGQRWTLRDERIAEVKIPASLAGVIQARLDRLPPQVKLIVQQASVIGRTFWDEAVAYVYGAAHDGTARVAVDAGLDLLQRREMVFVQPVSSFTGTKERLFKHALLRDVAYETVLKRLRKEYHGLAADWLIANSGDRQGEICGLIAGHLQQAGKAVEAVHYFKIASELAIAASANQEAIGYLENGLSLVEEETKTEAQIEQELSMWIQLGRLYAGVDGYGSATARRAFARAKDLAQQGGTPRQHFAVMFSQYSVEAGRGQWSEALAYGKQVLAMGERSGNTTLLLWAHYALGVISMWRAELAAMKAHFDVLLSLYDPQRHATQFRRVVSDPSVLARSYMATAHFLTGEAEQGRRLMKTAVREAEEMGHPFTKGEAWFTAAMFAQIGQDAAAARSYAMSALELAAAEKIPDYRAWSAIVYGWSLAALGKTADGTAQVEEGMTALASSGTRLGITYFEMLQAEVFRLTGDYERGLAIVEAALAREALSHELLYGAELRRLRGELLLGAEAGQLRAKRSFEEALAFAAQRGLKLHELRAAISLARLEAEEGREEAARELLAAVYGRFNEGVDTVDLQAARALLEKLS